MALLGHQHHVVDEAADDLQRQLADILDGDAFGERLAADLRVLAAQCRPHGRIELGLDADDLGVRLQRLDGDGDAGDEAAAADRHDDRVEVGTVGDDLEADGALSGDDARVVVGMDERRAGARRRFRRRSCWQSASVSPSDDHLGAEPAGGGDLHERRRLRHDDGRRNAEPLGVVGDGLGVVAGRHGDDAARAFVRRQRQQLDQRAALLERGGRLQILVFDPDVGAGQPDRRGAGRNGVRMTAPAIWSAAARMSARVGRPMRQRRWSSRPACPALSGQQFGDERREIGEDAVGAGALEGEQRFHHRLLAVDPAVARRRRGSSRTRPTPGRRRSACRMPPSAARRCRDRAGRA